MAGAGYLMVATMSTRRYWLVPVRLVKADVLRAECSAQVWAMVLLMVLLLLMLGYSSCQRFMVL